MPEGPRSERHPAIRPDCHLASTGAAPKACRRCTPPRLQHESGSSAQTPAASAFPNASRKIYPEPSPALCYSRNHPPVKCKMHLFGSLRFQYASGLSGPAVDRPLGLGQLIDTDDATHRDPPAIALDARAYDFGAKPLCPANHPRHSTQYPSAPRPHLTSATAFGPPCLDARSATPFRVRAADSHNLRVWRAEYFEMSLSARELAASPNSSPAYRRLIAIPR